MYIDVIEHLTMNRMQVSPFSPCHDVIVHVVSDYEAIICDAALENGAPRT